MTTTINFDSVPKVRNVAKRKPDAGTTWYSHDGDKYPCLYLGVGKRAASWYFKGRLNGRSQQKALKATFPETTAAQAFEKIATLTEYHTGVVSTDIRTVRDACAKTIATLIPKTFRPCGRRSGTSGSKT